MRIVGKVVNWRDERGFGFATRPDADANIYFHIKDFRKRSRRPQVGDKIEFEIEQDRNGRDKATSIDLLSGLPLPPGFTLAALVAFSFVMLLIAGVGRDRLPWWLFLVYLGTGLLSALLYHRDKEAAQQGMMRTREVNLLVVDLLGGWIGGVFAQVFFRHKRRKPAFMFPFWLIVANHYVLGFMLGTGWPEQVPLIDALRTFLAGL